MMSRPSTWSAVAIATMTTTDIAAQERISTVAAPTSASSLDHVGDGSTSLRAGMRLRVHGWFLLAGVVWAER